jgi:uncharacterized protein with FMN-binding domain
MKKILTSSLVIISFIVYSFVYNKNNNANPALSNSIQNTLTSTTNLNNQTPTISDINNTTTSLYNDGEYLGQSADAHYGNIQVKAIIQNSKLVDIQILQYPNYHDESIIINSRALPILKQEAIRAQSEEIDGVTRATDTSIAFKQSLASALAQAKN